MSNSETDTVLSIDRDKGDFKYDVEYTHDAGRGLTEETIEYISNVKDEDEWILDFRKRALKIFNEKPMPTHWATPGSGERSTSTRSATTSPGARQTRALVGTM